MINAFIMGGPFMIILLVLALIILFISIKNFKQPYFTNGIMLLGILSVILGILATYIGVSNAFRAIQMAGDINPTIVLDGLKIATIPSVTGGIIMLLSTGIWYYFVKRHNLLIV
jgi:hypothetical protein